MKNCLFCLLFIPLLSFGQLNNHSFNDSFLKTNSEIPVEGNKLDMKFNTSVVYNAIPDGYHITYTWTFIAKNTEELDAKTLKKKAELETPLLGIGCLPSDIVLELVSLDPIYDFNTADTLDPKGFKVTENIRLTVDSFAYLPFVAITFNKAGIYDCIHAEAFVKNAEPIYAKMNDQLVVLVNQKKKLCKELGANLEGTVVHVHKQETVHYPSDRYLKSILRNAQFYHHAGQQNSQLALMRTVDVEAYYEYNLKQVDYVFFPENTEPVIQFYTYLITDYHKESTEEEIRKKIAEEMEQKKKPVTKSVFTIDEQGNFKKLEL